MDEKVKKTLITKIKIRPNQEQRGEGVLTVKSPKVLAGSDSSTVEKYRSIHPIKAQSKN